MTTLGSILSKLDAATPTSSPMPSAIFWTTPWSSSLSWRRVIQVGNLNPVSTLVYLVAMPLVASGSKFGIHFWKTHKPRKERCGKSSRRSLIASTSEVLTEKNPRSKFLPSDNVPFTWDWILLSQDNSVDSTGLPSCKSYSNQKSW
jgi:hypothetical protein